MANMQTAAQGAPVMDEAAMAEMRRLIFEAPIQELADAQGISIDEAVQLRVEKNLEAAEVPIEVSVRPIEPQGKLIGFASVNIGGIVIDDFKVVNGKNGIFLGEPSKPDPTTRTGYRSTARVTNRALQERLSAAAADGYNMAVEKLIARAEALRPKPIREQMANAAKEAAKDGRSSASPFWLALCIKFSAAVFRPEKDISSGASVTWLRGSSYLLSSPPWASLSMGAPPG